MKTRPLEPIYVALYAKLEELVADGVLLNTSRRLEHVNDYDVANMPAGFQNQTGIAVTSTRNGPLPKNRFTVDWYFYIPGGLTVVHATDLNAVIDAALTKLAPAFPGEKQTLGGLVEDVYVEGQIEMYEGVLQDRAVAVLPITVVAPGF